MLYTYCATQIAQKIKENYSRSIKYVSPLECMVRAACPFRLHDNLPQIPENCDLKVATLMPRGSRVREGAAGPKHVYQSLLRLWWGRGGARRTQAGVSATSPQSLSDIAAWGSLGPIIK